VERKTSFNNGKVIYYQQGIASLTQTEDHILESSNGRTLNKI